MSKNKHKFFVVWDGREPGIYNSWDECKKQTHEFPTAKFKAFPTLTEAREAFLSPYWNYVGKNAISKKIEPTKEQLEKFGIPITESISVDAACSGNPGIMEYRAVYTKTGEVLFRQGPFKNGTNNIGEFLALVHGLAYLQKQNSSLPLYTDSITALAWIRKKKANTKLAEGESNAIIFDLIDRAEKWLATNKWTTKILKWETEVWGEIPADFGRK